MEAEARRDGEVGAKRIRTPRIPGEALRRPARRDGRQQDGRWVHHTGHDFGWFRMQGPAFCDTGGIQAPNAATLLMGFLSSLLLSRAGKPARVLGLAASALMAVSVLGENSTLIQPAHHLVPHREGGNVVASPAGSLAPAVLVVAHFDTVNEGAAFNSRWVGLVRAGFYVYVAFPLLAVLLAVPRRRWPARLFRLGMLAGVVGMVQWQLLGKYNAGANDNGSGVAVALEAAERTGGDRRARLTSGSCSPTARKRASLECGRSSKTTAATSSERRSSISSR